MLNEIETISPDIQRVSDLSNRPNYPLTYGGDGMSATALKARFDALPLAVRDKVNQLLAALSAHSEQVSGASYIGISPRSYNEGRVTASSVADLVAALEDTGVAQLLMVHTGERICSLQECLQEYAEKLQQQGGLQWSLQDGYLSLYFPDGQMVDVPCTTSPQWKSEGKIMVADRGKYVLAGQSEVDILYPYQEVICSAIWSEELGRSEAELLTFQDAHTAVGNCMFGTVPEAGAICIVVLDNEAMQLPVAAIRTEDGSAHLHFSEMEITITPALEGVDVSVYLQSDAHQAGEILSLYISSFAMFEADLRICAGENGMTVRFPPTLYTGESPDFSPYSIWDIHLNSGVMTAHRLMDETEAATSGAVRVEQALEVIANAAY